MYQNNYSYNMFTVNMFYCKFQKYILIRRLMTDSLNNIAININ